MTTLSILTSDVGEFLDRSDLSAKIPLFAKLGQLFLERKWLPKFLSTTITVTISGKQFLIPSDSLGVRNVWLYTGNSTTKLTRKDELFVRQNSSSNKYYWRDQSVCELVSAPAAGSTIRLQYIQKATLLVNASDSNKWTLGAYDLFFWATVMQAALYQDNVEMATTVQNMMTSLADDLELFYVMEEHSDQASTAGDYDV